MNTSTISKILYIDDDSDDCIFLSESLLATGTDTDLVYAPDAEEAINYLTTTDRLPSLILLDLNMPKWDGRQTLAYLKSHPGFSNIPVMILSTSENAADREVCSRLGATSYYRKPYYFDEYKKLIKTFIPYLQGE